MVNGNTLSAQSRTVFCGVSLRVIFDPMGALTPAVQANDSNHAEASEVVRLQARHKKRAPKGPVAFSLG